MDNLLIHCSLTTMLWWDTLRWFNTSWAMPRSVKELMFSWTSGRRGRRLKAWNVALLALMWVIWREKYEDFTRERDEFCSIGK